MRSLVIRLSIFLPLLASQISLLALLVRPVTSYAIPSLLKGYDLRCCTILEPPIVQLDETRSEHFSGIAIEYLQMLELRLGFRCQTIEVFRTPSGALATFDEAVEDMNRCTVDGVVRNDSTCTCDIGVGGWAMSESRLEKVDFVQPFAFDYFRVLTHNNNTKSPAGDVFFFTAFETNVWIIIFVLIAVFALLKLLDDHLAPLYEEEGENEEEDDHIGAEDEDRDDRHGHLDSRGTHVQSSIVEKESCFFRMKGCIVTNKTIVRINKAGQSVVAHVTGHSKREIPGDYRRTRQWTLNFVIFICGFLLVLLYEASMTNALINEVWVSNYQSIDDFKTCKIPAEEVCVTNGTAESLFWKKAVASQECHLVDDLTKVQSFNSFEESFKRFMSFKCKYLIGLAVFLEEILHGPHCRHFQLTGPPFHDTGISFILPYQSNLSMIFSNVTLELHDHDLIPTPRRFLAREGECRKPLYTPIKFVKMLWYFVMVALSCAGVFVLMIKARRDEAFLKMEGSESE